MSRPWYRSAKDAWYVTIGTKAISLGVKGKDSLRQAVAACLEVLKRQAEPKHITVNELVDEYLASARRRVKANSLVSAQCNLRHLQLSVGDRKASEVSEAMLLDCVPDYSQSTRSGIIGAIKSLFKWAVEQGIITSNPARALVRPSVESRGAQALLTRDEIQTLLDACPAYFRPFFRLLHLTGARPSEIASITSENYDPRHGVVRLSQHKTASKGKVRVIVLCDEANAILQEQLAEHKEGHLLLSSKGEPFTRDAVSALFYKMKRKTGVKVSSYCLRHCFATEALEQGMPDTFVSALLGHSSTAMLHKHYSHLTSRVQVLKDAVNRLKR